MNLNLNIINKYFIPQNILDIGANIGDFNLYVQHFFPNAYVYSIEGNKTCENYLKNRNINYKICLLGSKKHTAIFYKNKLEPTSTGNSLYRELTPHFCDENLIEEFAEIETLDDVLINTNKTFDLIKIDTQGSEIDILKGGLNTLSKAKAVLLEVSYKPYNLNAPLEPDVISFMKKYGFEPAEVLDEDFNTGQRDLLFIK